jgi:hypothetical protein
MCRLGAISGARRCPCRAGRRGGVEVGAAAVERLKAAQRCSLTGLDALFASLQHPVFRGGL